MVVEEVSENIVQDQVSENIHSKAGVLNYFTMEILFWSSCTLKLPYYGKSGAKTAVWNMQYMNYRYLVVAVASLQKSWIYIIQTLGSRVVKELENLESL